MESLLKQPDAQHLSPTLPTLDQVQSHFEKWRSTRECRGNIPPALWDQVFLLVGRYPETDICNALRISKPRLQSAILSKPLPSQDYQTSVDFVPLTLSQNPLPSDPHMKDSIAAEILHTNGTTLRVHSLNDQQFSNMLLIFMKGSL
jgi:hypothetical protein